MGKNRQRDIENQIQSATEDQLTEQRGRLAAAEANVAAQRQAFTDFQFENPFADVENTFEDLQVSDADVRLQQEIGAQRDASILSQLSGAAGGSGIAGLATSLSQQGRLRDRQATVDYAKRLDQARMLAAQGEQRRQQLVAQGEAAVQQAEFGRESTLLAAEYNLLAGATAGQQAALANQMSGLANISSMQGARMGMYGALGGALIGGVASMGASALAPDTIINNPVTN